MIKEIIPDTIYSKDNVAEAIEKDSSDVTILKFPKLAQYEGLVHGVFCRTGGISKPPYDTLNVGDNIDDRKENVRKNLEIIKGIVKADSLHYLKQVHGKHMHTVDHDLNPGHETIELETIEADAIATSKKNRAIMIKQADCQAVILFDRVKKVIANIHCGWRGNRENILGASVEWVKEFFGCRPDDILAAIGPSLGPCCAEFISYPEIFPKSFRKFMKRENYFDLWELSRSQLIEAGLQDQNIESANLCTKCNIDLFFSYRGEGDTGRFATVAMMT